MAVTPKCLLIVVVLVSSVFAQEAWSVESRVYMANGFKIGEVDQDSAIVWTRLTRNPELNFQGTPFDENDGLAGQGLENLDDREGSVPGAAGEVRVVFWQEGAPDSSQATNWKQVDIAKDYTRQFSLEGLTEATEYGLRVEGRQGPDDESPIAIEGSFHTAPAPGVPMQVGFTVTTGQSNNDRDDLVNGHKIYPIMLRLAPDFFIHTGDIVYYDKTKPFATNTALARFKWNRMYAYPFQREFHQHVASFFMKDDHDLLKNDCWPGQRYGDLTFDEGLAIFREQVPMGKNTYRTLRWGKDLQIWLVEGRDFRSPNDMADGPEKTIWGKKQKKWFFDTVRQSDATFRILVSPTPLVGPDRSNKRDNHANSTSANEGNELREFIGKQKNMFVICGDRHWQYVTVDPQTGVREFSCGPASDEHAGGFNESRRSPMHQFLRIKGGFLYVDVERQHDVPQVTFRHYGVDGKIYHEEVHAAR